MSTILLTGSQGYLGSRLMRFLRTAGHKVTPVFRQPQSVGSDQVTYQELQKLEAEFDLIIHTATLYHRFGESASEVREANIQKPKLLIDFMQRRSPKCVFLNIDTALRPEINLYSATKREFRNSLQVSGVPYTNLVLDQFYGPGDSEKKFHTWLSRQLLFTSGQVPLTTGEQIRNFIYIDDLIKAIGQLIDSREQGMVRLIGPDTIQVRELAIMLCRLAQQPLSRLEFGKIPQRIANANEIEPIGESRIMRLEEPLVHLEQGMKIVIENELHHRGQPLA